MKKRKKILKIADLFSGAGGLSYPFYKRGHKINFAIDSDKYAVNTFKHNHMNDKSLYLNENIEDIFKKKYQHIFNKEYDLVMGGPPCQGFSTANRQNIINDPRNILYKYFLKFVKITQPKFVLIENVIGIKSKANDIIAELEKINYIADFAIFQASNYSIPQNRKRLIFFAVKKSNSNLINKFFDYMKNRSNTKNEFYLGDALYGLRPLKPHPKKNNTKNEEAISGYNIEDINFFKQNQYIDKINYKSKPKFIYNHKARYNNERDIEIFRRLPQGADSTHHSIKEIMPYKNRDNIFKDKYFKLNSKKICKTITSHMRFDCNMYIHPTQARGLSPREAARIQSFPDDFFFTGPISKMYMQIGNAVPPLLAKEFCLAIEKLLDD